MTTHDSERDAHDSSTPATPTQQHVSSTAFGAFGDVGLGDRCKALSFENEGGK